MTQVKTVITFSLSDTGRQYKCLANAPVMRTRLKTKNRYVMRTFPNLLRRQVYARRIPRQLGPA